jgi:hypothetical protein
MSTLENEIIASLSNDAAEALAALVSRTETAIVEADAEAKRQEAATWDPQIGPDPRIARDAHEKALVQAGRLRTLLARINRSLAAVAAEERLAAWHKEAAALGEERDNLVSVRRVLESSESVVIQEW